MGTCIGKTIELAVNRFRFVCVFVCYCSPILGRGSCHAQRGQPSISINSNMKTQASAVVFESRKMWHVYDRHGSHLFGIYFACNSNPHQQFACLSHSHRFGCSGSYLQVVGVSRHSALNPSHVVCLSNHRNINPLLILCLVSHNNHAMNSVFVVGQSQKHAMH